MRFNNAFLTSTGNVGMQFDITKDRILTVYKDHNNVLCYSEEATPEERILLRDQYVRREFWYSSQAARQRQLRAKRRV